MLCLTTPRQLHLVLEYAFRTQCLTLCAVTVNTICCKALLITNDISILHVHFQTRIMFRDRGEYISAIRVYVNYCPLMLRINSNYVINPPYKVMSSCIIIGNSKFTNSACIKRIDVPLEQINKFSNNLIINTLLSTSLFNLV